MLLALKRVPGATESSFAAAGWDASPPRPTRRSWRSSSSTRRFEAAISERVVHSLPCWRRIRADETRRAQVLADFRSAFLAASTFAAFCVCLSAREGLFPLAALASFGGLAACRWFYV